MNPSPSHCTSIDNPGSRWGWFATLRRALVRPTVPITVNAGDFSDHMLRDIGMRDGRPGRGDLFTSHPDLRKDIFKGSV